MCGPLQRAFNFRAYRRANVPFLRPFLLFLLLQQPPSQTLIWDKHSFLALIVVILLLNPYYYSPKPLRLGPFNQDVALSNTTFAFIQTGFAFRSS